jgi:hypothetical protein
MFSAPLDLDALSLEDLKKLVVQLLTRVAALEDENQHLRAEVARLKGLPKRPKLAPGSLDQATKSGSASQNQKRARRRPKRQSGRRTPPVTEERTLVVEVPPGSHRRGFEPYTVQDLVLTPHIIRFRRERWVTPDGHEIVAPLPPEVTGHFGPGVVRYVLMQHFQGQVTVERLLGQLKALGLRISKGEILALLTAHKEAFHTETEALLEAGLETAAWLTVDDTAARHAGHDEYTTHIGNDRFAWFATRPSKSRLNFLDLLRAGHPEYVINAAAAIYMMEHKLAEAVVIAVLVAQPRRFADETTWQAHLDRLGLGPEQRRRVTEAAVVGAIVARGLLTDTVIVSDEAGQFDVFEHALCWIHAERHLREIVCATEPQQHLVALQRQLVWWFYADLKAYKAEPSPQRRTALRQRFDRVFGRVTGFAELDEVVARLHANKDELLVVLDRPDIPLNTNNSESAVRSVVTKRKISGETRSLAGKQARDTFLSLLKTCAKHAISFWDYLGARLKIPDADPVPWLPDLIRQPALTSA